MLSEPFRQRDGEIHPNAMRPGEHRAQVLVEQIHGDLFAALSGREGKLGRQCRFSASGRTHDQRAGATIQAAAKDGIKRVDATGRLTEAPPLRFRCRDKPRVDRNPACQHLEIVQALPNFTPLIFCIRNCRR
jgi:hypothetical protein